MKNVRLILLALLFATTPLLAADHQILVSNFSFTPENLTIQVGDTVTWTNEGGTHNVRADDGSFRCANGCDGTGGNGDPAPAGWSFTLTFDEPAELIRYHCEPHGAPGGVGMAGTITVEGLEDDIFSDRFETP
ncbi:MAG: hypothetical protein GVY33_04240 [Alphaproteobacteria bacterium]|jgi:plastocyanin|nr:hypothetical protein [Alphaproteobacteria bacterium]